MRKKNGLILLLCILAIGILVIGVPYVKASINFREINKNINVSSVGLGMTEGKVIGLLGYKGEFEMCIYGYEHAYGELGLNIGYRADNHRVRRITIANNDDNILGVKKGMDVEQGRKILIDSGFVKDEESNYKFNKKNIQITLISKDGTMVDGISIEEMDESLVNNVY